MDLSSTRPTNVGQGNLPDSTHTHTMTHKTTLYVGLFDQHSHTQRFTTLEAFKIVDSLILSRFGGATISESHGIYRHNDGSTVIEPSLRIELVHETADQPLLDSLVQDIKLILNQESILVTRQEMAVSFV